MEKEPLLSSNKRKDTAKDRWKLFHNTLPLIGPQLRRRVSEIIDKSEDRSPAIVLPDVIESSWRHRIAFYLDSTPIGRAWEIMDTLLNLLLCVIYIINTHSFEPRDDDGVVSDMSDNYPEHTGLTSWQRNTEFILAVVLLFQFLPRIYLAVDARRFTFSTLSILTFISCIPVFLAYIDPRTRHQFMSAGWYAYFYPFRFMRLHIAINTCLVPSKTSILRFSLITRKAIRLLGFLLFLFLTVAAFLHVGTHMSQNVKDVTFFDAFYYAFVSATSGSASQIIPDSPFSRMIIVGVIISAAVFVPTNLAELLRLISNKSSYDHSFKRKTGQNHVVLCGKFEIGSLHTFLREFFCPDHGSVTVNTHIVILNPNEPSEELKMILEDPMYLNRVQYVIGTVMNPRSLEKVRITEANACFVFSSKYATDSANEDDAATVMRALALRKQVPDLPLHIQVILPEHKVHFDCLADTMVCIEELKLGMLAQNCRCPGFTTLMHMLTTSITEKSAKSLLASVSKDENNHDWLVEYIDGANQEIYPTVLSSGFRGLKFSHVSALIYSQFGAVTIALGIPNESYDRKMKLRDRLDEILETRPDIGDQVNPNALRINSTDFELYINPGNYVVKGGELAFLIASEEKVANKIAEYCPSDIVEMYEDFEDARDIRDLIDAEKSKKPPNGLVEIFKDKTKQKIQRNHRIITAASKENTRDHSVVLSPTEVKELLKADSQGLKEISSTGQHDNLVMPNNYPMASAASDALPSTLFDAETSSSSQRNSLKQNDSNLVTKILSQAIGGFSHQQRSLSISSSASSGPEDSVESIMEIDNHILVCDAAKTFPANLEYFIAPLRSKHLTENNSNQSPIVILSPADPTPHQRHLLEQFEDLVIIKGNPIARKDLLRAAVGRCRKAVVLANSSKGKELSERTADADSLLVVLNIEAMCSNKELFVITECIYEENMAFIGPTGIQLKRSKLKDKIEQTLMRPSFMSGHVYCQAMLDTVICQNYFNPHMLNIVRHILFSGSFGSEDRSSNISHSHIWLLQLPESLAQTKYSDLFMFLAKEYDAVPLGLYRSTNIERKLKSMSNDHRSLLTNFIKGTLWEFPMQMFTEVSEEKSPAVEKIKHRYVYLNPEPRTRIRTGDCVYVLSDKLINLYK